MNKRTAYFLLALALICAGALSIRFLKMHQKLGKPGVKVASVPLFDPENNLICPESVALPEHVSDYTSDLSPISPREYKFLPKDTTYGRRLYQSPDGFQILGSVILMGTDRTSIHKPEFCLPGQGWTILKEEAAAINIKRPFSYDLPVMKWVIGRKAKDVNGQITDISGVYVFWFVCENEITRYHGGRIGSIVKNLIKKGELERWAYVAYFSPCAPGEEEAAFQQMKDFIADSVPQFQLTTGNAPAQVATK